MRFLILLALLLAATLQDGWVVQTGGIGSGVDSNLRAVSVVTGGDGLMAVWASGSNGVILRSRDAGKSWQRLHVEDGDKLDFRGIRAFNAEVAYTLSVGPGQESRIYKTSDGGKSWMKQYQAARPEIFLDALVCRDVKTCFVIGDLVNGKFFVLSTTDGEQWRELARNTMPAALKDEGAFAASNSALTLCGGNELVFGTGGPAARVFRSPDTGRSWEVYTTPILSGNASSGIFSVACWDETIVVVGGDYKTPGGAQKLAAYSADHGKSWQLSAQQPSGFRSSAVRTSDGSLLASGTNGTDRSSDGGVHWARCSSLNLNALSAEGRGAWGVGPKGTIALLASPDHCGPVR
jgi:photosystem II stability/assembly factor-like uncharacterized protein